MERIEITEHMHESQPFRFKKFDIYQDRCAMKVGTDGVLLGGWAETSGQQYILDIGTGTGLLALMLAQRNPLALIETLEIDEPAFIQSQENFRRSPWSSQITAWHIALQDFRQAQLFDMIICNPPFYTHSPAMPDSPRKTARIAHALTPEELLDCAGAMLKAQGLLQLVLPEREGQNFVAIAQKRGWNLCRRTFVRTKPEKPISRHLIALSQTAQASDNNFEDELVIQFGGVHDYTEAFVHLLRDFYIIFD